MGFWRTLTGKPFEPAAMVDVEDRSAPLVFPAPVSWPGWPSDWSTSWTDPGLSRLVDTAWACIDLNSRVVSTMPVYRQRAGEVLPPRPWMVNPDDTIYSSWSEFVRQVMWDFQMCGEAFVLPISYNSEGYPLSFRAIPPWSVNAEMDTSSSYHSSRYYSLGGRDVTDEILHIRYMSSTYDARGHSPLESAGARLTTIGLLERYVQTVCETGGVPLYWIGVDRRLNQTEASDLLDQWVASRIDRLGQPALLSGGATLNQAAGMSAKDMTLLELSQFTEARIAVLLGVPPVLVALPSGGDSLTYSTTAQLFDSHARASLSPFADAVFSALSGWLLPRGQSLECNRDEYTRPGLKERAEAYSLLIASGVMSADEARIMERLGSREAAVSLSGGEMTGAPQPPMPVPQPVSTSGGQPQ